MEALLWAFTLFVAAVVYWYVTIPKNLPPGPWGLPFLGTLVDKKHPARQFRNMSIKHNSGIVSCYIFNQLFVFINDTEVLKEVFVRQGDKVANKNRTTLTELLKKDDEALLYRGNYGKISCIIPPPPINQCKIELLPNGIWSTTCYVY